MKAYPATFSNPSDPLSRVSSRSTRPPAPRSATSPACRWTDTRTPPTSTSRPRQPKKTWWFEEQRKKGILDRYSFANFKKAREMYYGTEDGHSFGVRMLSVVMDRAYEVRSTSERASEERKREWNRDPSVKMPSEGRKNIRLFCWRHPPHPLCIHHAREKVEKMKKFARKSCLGKSTFGRFWVKTRRKNNKRDAKKWVLRRKSAGNERREKEQANPSVFISSMSRRKRK